jgi:hypothetical protein
MGHRVKHHGFAHLLLIVVLFLLAVVVFGGWTEGPLTSMLWIGAKIYGVYTGVQGGDLDVAGGIASNMVTLTIIFVINLVIYYLLAALVIFIYNLFFGN